MTEHNKQHAAGHHHEHKSKKSGLHKDWRAWAVVLLMLAAMAAYMMSMDESIVPGGNGEQPPVPADGP